MHVDASLQVWDTCSSGHIAWAAADVGLERMGVVVENDALQVRALEQPYKSLLPLQALWLEPSKSYMR